jgi:hypothetical protein
MPQEMADAQYDAAVAPSQIPNDPRSGELEDLGSRNGVVVDGKRESSRALADGAWFLLARTILCFRQAVRGPTDAPEDFDAGRCSSTRSATCRRPRRRRSCASSRSAWSPPSAGRSPIPVDVAVISATRRDLDEMVEAERFRADLFARLAGFRLALPPLRRRMEDFGVVLAPLLPRLGGDGATRSTSRSIGNVQPRDHRHQDGRDPLRDLVERHEDEHLSDSAAWHRVAHAARRHHQLDHGAR